MDNVPEERKEREVIEWIPADFDPPEPLRAIYLITVCPEETGENIVASAMYNRSKPHDPWIMCGLSTAAYLGAVSANAAGFTVLAWARPPEGFLGEHPSNQFSLESEEA